MDNNNFNELLLHTLKQLGIRLDRVDDRLDRMDAKLDQKIYKADFKRPEATNEIPNHTERFDRIERRIRTTLWALGVEIALVGILAVFL